MAAPTVLTTKRAQTRYAQKADSATASVAMTLKDVTTPKIVVAGYRSSAGATTALALFHITFTPSGHPRECVKKGVLKFRLGYWNQRREHMSALGSPAVPT